jgi:hypothetical protein
VAIAVHLEEAASSDECAVITSIFNAYGVDVDISADRWVHRGGSWPYVVAVAAPVVYIALAFVRGGAEKAGSDTWDAYRDGGWRGLRRFTQEMAWARDADRRAPWAGERGGGKISLADPTGGPEVELSVGLDDTDFISLADLDWTAMKDGGYLRCHGDGKWFYNGQPAPQREIH